MMPVLTAIYARALGRLRGRTTHLSGVRGHATPPVPRPCPHPSGQAFRLARPPRRATRTVPDYLPFDQRRPSTAYREMLGAIRDSGTRVQTKQGGSALALA